MVLSPEAIIFVGNQGPSAKILFTFGNDAFVRLMGHSAKVVFSYFDNLLLPHGTFGSVGS